MIMWMMRLSINTQISKWPILEKWDMGPICGTIFSLGSDSPWYIMYVYKHIKVTLELGSWSGSEFRSLIFKFGCKCKYTALESGLHKLGLDLGHFWGLIQTQHDQLSSRVVVWWATWLKFDPYFLSVMNIHCKGDQMREVSLLTAANNHLLQILWSKLLGAKNKLLGTN